MTHDQPSPLASQPYPTIQPSPLRWLAELILCVVSFVFVAFEWLVEGGTGKHLIVDGGPRPEVTGDVEGSGLVGMQEPPQLSVDTRAAEVGVPQSVETQRLQDSEAIETSLVGKSEDAGVLTCDSVVGSPTQERDVLIVLLTGYGNFPQTHYRVFVQHLCRWLEDNSLSGVICAPRTWPIASVARQAATVEDAISKVERSFSFRRQVIAAHSFGGLVARHVTKQSPPSRPALNLYLGTPHAGTPSAWLSAGSARWDMTPRRLDPSEKRPIGGLLREEAVFGCYDLIVPFMSSTALEIPSFGAPVDHAGLVWRREAIDLILKRIDLWMSYPSSKFALTSP